MPPPQIKGVATKENPARGRVRSIWNSYAETSLELYSFDAWLTMAGGPQSTIEMENLNIATTNGSERVESDARAQLSRHQQTVRQHRESLSDTLGGNSSRKRSKPHISLCQVDSSISTVAMVLHLLIILCIWRVSEWCSVNRNVILLF